jgi:hypothetical protein
MRVKTFRSVRDAEGKFVQISNKLAQDSRLSLRAKGLVLYALSCPPDQPHTSTSIAAANKEGREAVRTALKELEDLGYYRITRVQARDGSWSTETELSDAPKPRNPAPENPSSVPPSETNKSPGRTEDQESVGRVSGRYSSNTSSNTSSKDVASSDEAASEDASLEESTPPSATAPGRSKDGAKEQEQQPRTEGQRAHALTKAYEKINPLCSFMGVRGVVAKAIKTGRYSDTQIGDALAKLASEGRVVTADTLRIALEGQPRKTYAEPDDSPWGYARVETPPSPWGYI